MPKTPMGPPESDPPKDTPGAGHSDKTSPATPIGFGKTAMMDSGPKASDGQDASNPAPEKGDESEEQLIDGRYRLGEMLGEGGMGAVYKGTHVLMDKPVAIKLIHGELAHVPEIEKRFHREARSASRLTDPHCITVTDFGRTEDGTLFLVMELLDGKPLSDLLDAEGPLAPERAILIAKHILKALMHAHGAGVVHRDLKPENVMLVEHGDEADFVKVFDFGIAKLASGKGSAENLTRAGLIVGTPAYLAPEQGLGDDADHRADLYAMGVILYEMLAGFRPFSGGSAVDIVYAHLSAPIPALPRSCSAPSALQKIIKTALAKKPGERYQTAELFHEALEKIDFGAPVKQSLFLTLARFFYPIRNAASRLLAKRLRALPTPVRLRLEQIDTTGLVRMTDPVRKRFAKMNPSKRRFLVRASLAVVILLAVLGIATWRTNRQTFVKPAELTVVEKPGVDEDTLEKLFDLADEQIGNGLYSAAAVTARNAIRISPTQPVAHLLLGHALFLSEERANAMQAYATALQLDTSLVKDTRLGAHLQEGLKSPRSRQAAANLLATFGGENGVEILAARANSPLSDVEEREGVRRVLLENGHEDAIDWVASLSADLHEYKSCKKKRRIIGDIVKTGNPDFLPLLNSLLEKAKSEKRSRGIFRRFRSSHRSFRCVKKDLEKAITILRDK